MTTSPPNGNAHARESLILSQLPLACELAYQEHRKLPRWIGLDEARSAAYLALVQAVDRWDASRGVPLGAWVRKPIRGAVLDLGRRKAAKLAWVPQDQALGPYYMEKGIDGEACHKQTVDPAPSPESVLAFDEFRAALWRRVDALPPRLALVIRMRFCGDLPYERIGRVLRRRLSSSRVEALRTEAFKMLRGEG